MINYHNKSFKAIENTENGETSEETIFNYQQYENIISAHYSGGKIKKGHLLGLLDKEGILQFSYHQINEKNEVLTGKCISKPEVLPNGKIRLHEEWEWTSGDQTKGKSIIEEI